MSAAKLQTAVLGATGYSGFELVRLMLRHPRLARPLLLTREGDAQGAGLEEFYPQLAGEHLPMEPFQWEALSAHGVKVLFLATPHELSRELVPPALEHGLRVVDLSGAWRLKKAEHRAIYGFTTPIRRRRRSWTRRPSMACRSCIARRLRRRGW